MEPNEPRETRPTKQDTPEPAPIDRDVDDPELVAWLLEREQELAEQADALAMRDDEEWRP